MDLKFKVLTVFVIFRPAKCTTYNVKETKGINETRNNILKCEMFWGEALHFTKEATYNNTQSNMTFNFSVNVMVS